MKERTYKKWTEKEKVKLWKLYVVDGLTARQTALALGENNPINLLNGCQ